jgi:hypothetical protein
MKQLVNGALNIVLIRIKNCGQQLRHVSDQYTLDYWQKELNKALNLKMIIEDRFKVKHNVLYVDFQTKKRVA